MLDFLLMGVGSSLAVWSAGQSIQNVDISWFYVRLVVFGTITSYLVRSAFRGQKLLGFDGILYALAAAGSVYYANALNTTLPGDTFPRELIAAGWLGWMLSFGAFLTWRDGTLLFQAVPAIAMFGLVGCYDTYRDVVWTFFGYLVCLATLFGRAHGREMLRQAALSGYATRAEARGDRSHAVRQDQALYERMREGPWRWVAGAEWALASALVIILLSLLGAPVVERSVKSVAGNVRVRVSNVRVRPSNPADASGQGPNLSDQLTVGNGPNNSLTAQPVFEARGALGAQYWRSSAYDVWTGRGWNATWQRLSYRDGNLMAASLNAIAKTTERTYSIRRIITTKSLPSLGEGVRWNPPRAAVERPDGMWEATGETNYSEVRALAIFPREGEPRDAQNDLPSFLAQTQVPQNLHPEVRGFFAKVLNALPEDAPAIDRANALKRAIAEQVLYNINAPATPTGDDPVRFFLFGSGQGYCDVFASTMTLAARTAGIPARYVQGYLPEEDNRTGDMQLILDRDYHAWAELFFKDVGWVVFDATEGARSVPGGERGNSSDRTPWYQAAGLRHILDYAIIAVAVAGFAYLIWRSRQRPMVDARRVALARAYEEFSDELDRAVGKRLSPSLTPRERLAASEASLDGAAEMARQLTKRFESALYGREEPDQATLDALRTDLRQFRQMARRKSS
ncbi:DUF4129 domain-containing protein [bacterium]|nr:MAG: DUF4129 domain-containing protein [bacterium]